MTCFRSLEFSVRLIFLPAVGVLQICDLQKVEDMDVVFGEDLAGPLSAEQTAEAKEETETEGDTAPAKHAAGEQTGAHGDTTEESSEGGDAGDPGMESTTPSAAASSHSSNYEDSELERGQPPAPAPAACGKSSPRAVVDPDDDDARKIVDLSSGSDSDSEGSSAVSAVKPTQLARRTKEAEAAAGKA